MYSLYYIALWIKVFTGSICNTVYSQPGTSRVQAEACISGPLVQSLWSDRTDKAFHSIMRVLWRRGRWLQMMQSCDPRRRRTHVGWRQTTVHLLFLIYLALFSFSTHMHTLNISYIICLWLTHTGNSAVLISLPYLTCIVWLMESSATITLHKNNVSCMNSIWINRADIWELKAVGIGIILCEICVAVKHFPSRHQHSPVTQQRHPSLKSKAKEQSDP